MQQGAGGCPAVSSPLLQPPGCRRPHPVTFHLRAGVFRSDLPTKFRCKPEAYQVGGRAAGWVPGWCLCAWVVPLVQIGTCLPSVFITPFCTHSRFFATQPTHPGPHPHPLHMHIPSLIPLSRHPPARTPPPPQRLIDKLDGDLEYALRTDGKMAPEDCKNYAEVGCGAGMGLVGRLAHRGGRPVQASASLLRRTCCCLLIGVFGRRPPPTPPCPALQVRDEIRSMLERLRDTPTRCMPAYVQLAAWPPLRAFCGPPAAGSGAPGWHAGQQLMRRLATAAPPRAGGVAAATRTLRRHLMSADPPPLAHPPRFPPTAGTRCPSSTTWMSPPCTPTSSSPTGCSRPPSSPVGCVGGGVGLWCSGGAVR